MKGMAYHGWKVGLPDKFWPVTLDNFFDNPDEIRELGLRMLESDKYPSPTGHWPGYRSGPLYRIDEVLAQSISCRILNCYFNLNWEQVFWNRCNLQFQLISSRDKDKNNIKNKGWIHRDGVDPRKHHHPDPGDADDLAGLIYLTPDIERNTGTSLFDMKKDKTLEHDDSTAELRTQIHLGNPVNDKEIKEKWEKHRSCFVEKVRFENIYNRLIMYDTNEFHGVNSYYTPEDKDDRLTLGFFMGGIRASKWPLERIKEIKC